MSEDKSHLNLLAIFHYVLAALNGFFLCVPGVYMAIGIVIATGNFPNSMRDVPSNQPPPEFLGWFMVAFASIFLLIQLAHVIFLVLVGRFLNRRYAYTFCLVISCLQVIDMPFGTYLGIFTVVVLMRPSVKRLFERAQSSELTFDDVDSVD